MSILKMKLKNANRLIKVQCIYLKNTVNITNANNKLNSRLFKSNIFFLKNLDSTPPNDTLLYIYIVYAAENTMDELANIPNKGNLSNDPN